MKKEKECTFAKTGVCNCKVEKPKYMSTPISRQISEKIVGVVTK